MFDDFLSLFHDADFSLATTFDRAISVAVAVPLAAI